MRVSVRACRCGADARRPRAHCAAARSSVRARSSSRANPGEIRAARDDAYRLQRPQIRARERLALCHAPWHACRQSCRRIAPLSTPMCAPSAACRRAADPNSPPAVDNSPTGCAHRGIRASPGACHDHTRKRHATRVSRQGDTRCVRADTHYAIAIGLCLPRPGPVGRGRANASSNTASHGPQRLCAAARRASSHAAQATPAPRGSRCGDARRPRARAPARHAHVLQRHMSSTERFLAGFCAAWERVRAAAPQSADTNSGKRRDAHPRAATPRREPQPRGVPCAQAAGRDGVAPADVTAPCASLHRTRALATVRRPRSCKTSNVQQCGEHGSVRRDSGAGARPAWLASAQA